LTAWMADREPTTAKLAAASWQQLQTAHCKLQTYLRRHP